MNLKGQLLLILLAITFAGCQLSKKNSSSDQKVRSDFDTISMVSVPLHSPETQSCENDASCTGTSLISLHEATFKTIANFRHPTGLHTARFSGDHLSSPIVLMPPALTRKEQLQFYRDLNQAVFEAQVTYWRLALAQAGQRSIDRQHALVDQLVELEYEKLNSDRATTIEVNAAQIRANLAKESTLQLEMTNEYPTVLSANDDFVIAAGLPGGRFEPTDQPDASFSLQCTACDINQMLRCNPEVLLQRYQYVAATQGANFSLESTNLNCEHPDVPVTLQDIGVQSEKKAANEYSRLRENMRKASQALELVTQRLTLQQQQVDWIQEAVNHGESTADKLLLAELEFERTVYARSLLIGRIQVYKTTYAHQMGKSLAYKGIRFPDFWLAKNPEFCTNLSTTATCSGLRCPQTVQSVIGHPVESIGTVEDIPSMGNNDQSAPQLMIDSIEDTDLLPTIQPIE